jgi:hypothetical protein
MGWIAVGCCREALKLAPSVKLADQMPMGNDAEEW